MSTPSLPANTGTGCYRTQRTRAGARAELFVDDEVLAAEGVTDLSRYAVVPGAPLLPDLFL